MLTSQFSSHLEGNIRMRLIKIKIYSYKNDYTVIAKLNKCSNNSKVLWQDCEHQHHGQQLP